jgi:hypothetical protein
MGSAERPAPPAEGLSPEGGCTCRAVRYRLVRAPLIVHCCHCRWCQRETGSAFVINCLVETIHLVRLAGEPQRVLTPSNSGKGQTIARCPSCQVAVWSHYAGLGERLAFIRVGTLDEPERFPPDVHIYTESKQPWVVIPAGARSFAQYYSSREVWSEASLARRQALLEQA